MLETCTITPQLTHKHSYIHPEFEKSTLMVIICIVEKKEQKHHKQIYETYEKNIYFLLNVKLYTYSLYSCIAALEGKRSLSRMIWCSLKFRCQLYTQLIFCWSVRWRPRSLREGWWARWTPSSSARRTTAPPPSPERGSQAGSRGPPGMGSCQSYYKCIENMK